MARLLLSSNGAPPFAMVRLAGADCLLLEALRSGQIEPVDLGVFWCVVLHLNWRSGRCWAGPAELAAAMGCGVAEMEAALDRLLAADLLVRGRHLRAVTRQYLCCHPRVATTGGPYRKRAQWLQFHKYARNPERVSEQATWDGATRAIVR